ncbi:hypothetical protein D3C86_1262790 [compost metagenome]
MTPCSYCTGPSFPFSACYDNFTKGFCALLQDKVNLQSFSQAHKDILSVIGLKPYTAHIHCIRPTGTNIVQSKMSIFICGLYVTRACGGVYNSNCRFLDSASSTILNLSDECT